MSSSPLPRAATASSGKAPTSVDATFTYLHATFQYLHAAPTPGDALPAAVSAAPAPVGTAPPPVGTALEPADTAPTYAEATPRIFGTAAASDDVPYRAEVASVDAVPESTKLAVASADAACLIADTTPANVVTNVQCAHAAPISKD